MGLASRQSQNPKQSDAPSRVRIIDTIDMKESLQIAYAPGLVTVLDSFPSADPQAFVGRMVRLRTPAGCVFHVRVEAVRDHGATISFFFRGLTRADIPTGSHIEFGD